MNCHMCAVPTAESGYRSGKGAWLWSGAWVFSASNLLIRPQVGPFSPSEGRFDSTHGYQALVLGWVAPHVGCPGQVGAGAQEPPGRDSSREPV